MPTPELESNVISDNWVIFPNLVFKIFMTNIDSKPTTLPSNPFKRALLYTFSILYHACKRHGEKFIKQAFDIPWRDVNTIKRCEKACKNQQKDLSFEVRWRKHYRCDGKTNNNSLVKGLQHQSFPALALFSFSQRVVICLHSIFYYHGYF